VVGPVKEKVEDTMNRNTLATVAAFVAVFFVFGGVAWWWSRAPERPETPVAVLENDTGEAPARSIGEEPPFPEDPPVAEDTAGNAEVPERPKGPAEQKERPRGAGFSDEDLYEEIEVDGRPEDGGRAFGHAVCVKKRDCGCPAGPPRACLRTWQFIKPEDFATAKCLLDLSCEAICNYESAPQAQSCRTQVNELTSARFGARSKGSP